jgi:tRNA A-37 threonylcarbamoyl transferase component Bud32
MATAESCRSPDELRAQLAGPLSQADREVLARHLEKCPRCRATAEVLLAEQRTAGGFRSSQQSHGTVVSASGDDVTLAAPPPSDAMAMPAPTPLPAPAAASGPRQLSHFRVIRQLGAGGMGEVYLAEDIKLERRVALKLMRPELAAVELHKLRFLREARETAKIQNDHIVTIYHVDEADGVPFLAMQLLQGESMESWLQRGQRPTPGQAARLGREIAVGLAAAHVRGLIHRDIKPGNLWLEAPRGRVKILDFGLARTTTGDVNLTTSGVIVGTPAYMAPEQARGTGVDSRADLYSLGVVLFRLCTGRLPFEGGDAMTCLIAAATEAPLVARDLNPDVPASLSDLIGALLEKDPARRPPSAAAVAHRLSQIEAEIRRNRDAAGVSGGDSLAVQSARNASVSLVAAPPPRRRRWPLPAAGAALVALLAAGVGAWFLTDNGTVEFRAEGDGLRVVVEQDGKVLHTLDEPNGASLRLRSGRYALAAELKPGVPGTGVALTTDQGTNEVRVERGGKVLVTVRRADRPAGSGAADTAANPPDGGSESHTPAVPVRLVIAPALNADVRYLNFVADGRLLAVGSRSRLQTYNAADLRRMDSLPWTSGNADYKGGVGCMALTPDGKSLAVRTPSGKVVLWNTATRAEGATVAEVSASNVLEFSPDGKVLAVADGKTVRILKGKDFKETDQLTRHPNSVTALAFAPGGKKLAVGCLDGSLWLWDLATRQHEDVSPVPRSSEVLGLSFTSGGRRLAVGRPHDTKVLFVGSSPRELFTFKSQGGAVAFSPDGRWLAMSDARRLSLHDLANRKRHNLPPEHGEVITRVAFAPDERSVATGGKDGSVRVWDVASLVDGLAPLFSGHDLMGWKSYDAPADTFGVDNGSLVASGKARGWILTDGDYADFDLRLEYRLTPGADSGVAVHAAAQKPVLYGMEIRITDDEHARASGSSSSSRPEMRTGSIYNLRAPSVLNHNKVGEWNQLHILVEGRRVVVDVNGLRVVDHEIDAADLAKRPELARATGRIGLQSENGRVEFRNLIVKRLRPAEKK